MLGRGAAVVVLGVGMLLWAPVGMAESELDTCLREQDLVRVTRVLDPDDRVVFARVVDDVHGHVSKAVEIAPGDRSLREVFERASEASGEAFPVSDDRVCAVVDLPEAAIDDETRVIVSTGLNYAAHAEEAGGGDVFLFPKPAAPTSAYARVAAPGGVMLLDYEVELAYVLLEEIVLDDPLTRDEFLDRTAFFLSNDISDREAIVRNASLSGTSTGFPEAKGQPGFFPAGPWMVRGSELFAALEACGADGLGLRLAVTSQGRTEMRQSASTSLMIIDPWDLIDYLRSWVDEHGRRSSMPFVRDAESRFYPLAVDEQRPMLSAGSIVQTGTPEGVAMNAPDGALGLAMRGLLRLRSPFQQFIHEERARFEAGDTGYLAPGDEILAEIDGLGAQNFMIGEAGSALGVDPCQPR